MEEKRWTILALVMLSMIVGLTQGALNDGRHTLYIEEVCVPSIGRCLSEILWDGDNFDTGGFSTDDIQPEGGGGGKEGINDLIDLLKQTSGGTDTGFPGFVAREAGEEDGGTGHAPAQHRAPGHTVKRVDEDIAHEEEVKHLDVEHTQFMRGQNAAYTKLKGMQGSVQHKEKEPEEPASTVTRNADSPILMRFEELYGGMPWAEPFTKARENIKNMRSKEVPEKKRSSVYAKALRQSGAVVETIRGRAPAGGITVSTIDMPHTSRQGPVRSVPLSPIIGASMKKRTQARTAVGIGGVQAMIEGVSGNYPVHFRKSVDSASAFIFQAATDFDPYGTWRYADPTERPCPHLFNLQFILPLTQRNGRGLELHLTFVDAIITEVKMTLPRFTDSGPSKLYEDVYFMYRGLTWNLYESGVLIDSGSHTDGFRNGVPPVPIPGGEEGCCEEIPWTINPPPDCSLFELNYPIILNTTIAPPLQPWDVYY